jgi:hypothetical protein
MRIHRIPHTCVHSATCIAFCLAFILLHSGTLPVFQLLGILLFTIIVIIVHYSDTGNVLYVLNFN